MGRAEPRLTPLELIEQLDAVIPRPRVHADRQWPGEALGELLIGERAITFAPWREA